jgi:hypothetical protein
LGIHLNRLLQSLLVGAEPAVAFGQFVGAGLEMLERRWGAVDRCAVGEVVVLDVGVLAGEDPAFDACFGCELEDGQGAGGADRGDGQETVGGGLDGVAFVPIRPLGGSASSTNYPRTVTS